MGIVWTCCTGRKDLKLIEYLPDLEEDDVFKFLYQGQPCNITEKIKNKKLKQEHDIFSEKEVTKQI